MAQIMAFHYLYKDSILHNMDVRIKLICLAILSITIGFASSAVDFCILTITVAVAVGLSQLPVAKIISEIKLFIFLIIAVMIVHAVSIPGKSLPLLPWLTQEGLVSGFVFAWRMFLVITLCVILTGTTSLIAIGNAVEWFFRPIPFIPETRVATMINLTFVLIPLIFDQAAEMIEAQKARCIDSRRNPVRKIRYLVLPLLLQTFERAGELGVAMESRCYSEDRTKPVFNTGKWDWAVMLFSVLIALIIIALHLLFKAN